MVATKRKRTAKPNPKNIRPKKTAQTGVIRADEVLTVDAFGRVALAVVHDLLMCVAVDRDGRA